MNSPASDTSMRPNQTVSGRSDTWPSLPLAEWSDTWATLHMWLQIVGKIRMAKTPWVNHGWNVTLYVSGRGLTTGPIPYDERAFEIEFDFNAHELLICTSDGRRAAFALRTLSVAAFYRRIFEELTGLGLTVKIHGRPNEVVDAVPFATDEQHRTYDTDYANRFWRILVQADSVLKQFRSRFIGKCSPVHFFWGGGDLAVTRFSGRPAPQHPGGIPNMPDPITREAYSHEVSSAGFWPGGAPIPYPAFYSYAYPAPKGFAEAAVKPKAAFYSSEMGEFFLPYDAVREAESPESMLLDFLQSTYDAAADLGGWDRKALER